MAIFSACCWILLWIMNFDVNGPTNSRLHGSQVPWRSSTDQCEEARRLNVDPRVTREFTTRVGVPSGTKPTEIGKHTASHQVSWTAKRSFRRARQRAAVHGGTVYKGRWRTAASLGVYASRQLSSDAGGAIVPRVPIAATDEHRVWRRT